MSLTSLFENPDGLIKRFRHSTLYSRSIYVFLLLFGLISGIVYLFIVVPAYSAIGAGVSVLLMLFLNRLYEAILLIKAFEARGEAYKHIYMKIDRFTHALGIEVPYRLYIRKGGPYAKLFSVFGIKRLIIGLDLITSKLPDEEISFVIAHEFAKYKIRRAVLSLFAEIIDDLKRVQLFNSLLYPFERAVVLTADRIASMISGSPEHCVKMIKIEMLGLAFKELHTQEFLNFQEPRRDFVSWIVDATSDKPNPTKRVEEILKFYDRYKILYAKRHERDGMKNHEQPISLQI